MTLPQNITYIFVCLSAVNQHELILGFVNINGKLHLIWGKYGLHFICSFLLRNILLFYDYFLGHLRFGVLISLVVTHMLMRISIQEISPFLARTLNIRSWRWRHISRSFVSGFHRSLLERILHHYIYTGED